MERVPVRTQHNRLIHLLPKGLNKANDKPFYIRLARSVLALPIIASGLLTAHSLPQPWAALVVVVLSVGFGISKTQISLRAHEVGHSSAIRNKKANRHIGNALGPGLLGISRTQWIEKHKLHHDFPNREEMDTDIDFPVLAFEASQALQKRKIAQPIIRHQHLWILPLMCLQAFNAQWGTIRYLWRKPEDYKVQSVGVAFHWGYMLALAYLLGPAYGTAFFLLSGFANGLSNGSVFAPNHKGMGLIPEDAPFDWFLDQVVPSRNIHGNNRLTQSMVNFWYGGLQYQIEHHLFPMMAMDNLEKIAPYVRAFCEEEGVSYASATPWQSTREIFHYLRGVANTVSANHRLAKSLA